MLCPFSVHGFCSACLQVRNAMLFLLYSFFPHCGSFMFLLQSRPFQAPWFSLLSYFLAKFFFLIFHESSINSDFLCGKMGFWPVSDIFLLGSIAVLLGDICSLFLLAHSWTSAKLAYLSYLQLLPLTSCKLWWYKMLKAPNGGHKLVLFCTIHSVLVAVCEYLAILLWSEVDKICL